MARNRRGASEEPGLYEAHEQVVRHRVRRQRALFIPRFLREAASDAKLHDDAQERAYQIAVRWADLETSGFLREKRETSIDTQFLDQIFGEGLGYAVKTASPDKWQLEHKFPVPGVGQADGAIGDFPAQPVPVAVIELKDAQTDLDRDRRQGRTPVQQCWDYLNALPECPWGIVSNFRTIRLYHRDKTPQSFEEFSLQEMRDRHRFNEFYCLFERGGFLPSRLRQRPRALELLRDTANRQKEVGNELYDFYHHQRLLLIDHLMNKFRKSLDEAIRIAQKLLDRIIFIAFCEDRDLLNEKCLDRAYSTYPAFQMVKNQRWQNFLGLFHHVDVGSESVGVRDGYNGLLFKPDPEIDGLELSDEPWTTAFRTFGNYDFSEEVNVEVLGHIFERSITELEKLRLGGRFALLAGLSNGNGSAATTEKPGRKTPKSNRSGADDEEESASPKMPKSAQRKRFGIYYTPPAFTGLIVERTVDVMIGERFAELQKTHKVDPDAREDQPVATLLAYYTACLAALKSITVCDPACGSGAFLIRAYDALEAQYRSVVHGLAGAGLPPKEVTELEEAVPDLILSHNLFGVDLSHEAVEITQLALWIRSARRNRKLTDLSKNIVCGNSLVDDPTVDPKALDWSQAFPSIFRKESAGFACVIGNPPWERIKLQEREFFALTDPETAESVSAADRRKRLAAMPEKNPELFAAYETALERAQKTLDYARASGRFPLTGKGDVNTYMLFAELAKTIVAPNGMVGLLVPSGIATDDTTKEYFNDLMDRKVLISLYDFENKEGHFEDVHRSFKFTALVFGGDSRKADRADFVFFARNVEDTVASNKQRHIPLTAADMKLLNPNTRTCPIFRTRRDAELTKSIYKRVPILIDENRKTGGNPWGIKFFTMFHQTNDAEHFQPAKYWEKKKYKLQGNVYVHGKKRALPLYEAKMVQAFDHRAASVVIEESNWFRQGQKEESSLVAHQNPEFLAIPRWWMDEDVVARQVEGSLPAAFLAFKNVTSPTNTRTMIASFIPFSAVGNSAPLILPAENIKTPGACCLLANLNSYVLDYVARQKIGNVNLNFYLIEQFPMLHPTHYADKCPWSKRETLEHWISERVLKLSCTAEDMIPLAKACGFKGSRGDGVHIWKQSERAQLRAELDAAYFHLYGVMRDDVAYILSTFTNTGLLPEEDRPAQQCHFEPGSIGDSILTAYDRRAQP